MFVMTIFKNAQTTLVDLFCHYVAKTFITSYLLFLYDTLYAIQHRFEQCIQKLWLNLFLCAIL